MVLLEVAVVLAQAWLGFSSPSSSYLRCFYSNTQISLRLLHSNLSVECLPLLPQMDFSLEKHCFTCHDTIAHSVMKRLLPWAAAPASAGQRDVLWAEVRLRERGLSLRAVLY